MPVGIVKFAGYRQYEKVRIEASNAIMGLLAGAQIAAHMLQLTWGSDRPPSAVRFRHAG
jgi:hypothetical protein